MTCYTAETAPYLKRWPFALNAADRYTLKAVNGLMKLERQQLEDYMWIVSTKNLKGIDIGNPIGKVFSTPLKNGAAQKPYN